MKKLGAPADPPRRFGPRPRLVGEPSAEAFNVVAAWQGGCPGRRGRPGELKGGGVYRECLCPPVEALIMSMEGQEDQQLTVGLQAVITGRVPSAGT